MPHGSLDEYLGTAHSDDDRSGSSTRMQHNFEGLDRPGGIARVGLLRPLRSRDFRLLWAGMSVSLIGDGIFLIAIAWTAYSLWNTPAASRSWGSR